MGHRGFAIFAAAATPVGCWCGPAAAREQALHSLSGGTDGGAPPGGLTFDGGGDVPGTGGSTACALGCGGRRDLGRGGKLYGMTSGGGNSNQGTVYEISP